MCYYTIQGRTVRDKHIVLMDTGHRHFSRRALIVGMSRATHGQYVHIATAKEEEIFSGKRRRSVKARRVTAEEH